MASKGGKRPGAGRPKGTTEIPKIRNYFTAEEMEVFARGLMERAETSDKIATWLADQIFGKAHQTIDANVGGTLTITFDPAFKKND
ncbi:hypothetical protein C4568_03710 [Candidatus Parcubacteria bacterium]|nr:MAG: hypothetical protein C4568_03710 [Candidatus Parcubacteria bacterium]